VRQSVPLQTNARGNVAGVHRHGALARFGRMTEEEKAFLERYRKEEAERIEAEAENQRAAAADDGDESKKVIN